MDDICQWVKKKDANSTGLCMVILNMIGYINGGCQLLYNLIGVYNIFLIALYTCDIVWAALNDCAPVYDVKFFLECDHRGWCIQ